MCHLKRRSGRPKVKVTLEGQFFARTIAPTILDGFQYNFHLGRLKVTYRLHGDTRKSYCTNPGNRVGVRSSVLDRECFLCCERLIPSLKSLPNKKKLDMPKSKVFAHYKVGMPQTDTEINSLNDRKQCVKKRQCWLSTETFTHFLTMFH